MLLSRPTLAEVMDYRLQVDEAMDDLFAAYLSSEHDTGLLAVIELGLHHEQQHQELMLMDIKHVFSRNPLRPAYRDLPVMEVEDVRPSQLVELWWKVGVDWTRWRRIRL